MVYLEAVRSFVKGVSIHTLWMKFFCFCYVLSFLQCMQFMSVIRQITVHKRARFRGQIYVSVAIFSSLLCLLRERP